MSRPGQHDPIPRNGVVQATTERQAPLSYDRPIPGNARLVDVPASALWSAADRPDDLDARPILVRRDDSIWTRAERRRDDFATALEEFCAQEKLKALVVKSGPFTVPAQIEFECWMPEQDRLLTERAKFTISVAAREFYRFDLVYTIHVRDRGKTRTYDNLHDLSVRSVVELARYLVRRGAKPSLSEYELRRYGWQFWRPLNKVILLKPDWLQTLAIVVGLIGLLAVGVTLLGAVPLLGAIVGWVLLRRRRITVRSSGKPDGEPRILHLVDSWQAVITGAGNDAHSEIKKRLLSSMGASRPPDLRLKVEKIWYWGLEGKVEREQIVLGLGRALCYCHVYGYGAELYVGWDGHVNYGQWVEKNVAHGIDRVTGRLVDVSTVAVGYQPISEYDLTDLNWLMEWTHAKLTEQVKLLMKERKIDAEIDFRIQRGERQSLTGDRGQNEGPISAAKTAARRLQGGLRRTA